MSGHSKWHNIKVRKEKQDGTKAKFFTRVSREIILAVKHGGPDPDNNLTLKNAIERAREVNMPNDNIKKVIEKAAGGGEGTQLEEIYYEGYGSGGVAVMVKAATDNRNRTSSAVRAVFTKYGGNLGEIGCVRWSFKHLGSILVPVSAVGEDRLMEIIMEAGAEDMQISDGFYEIQTAPEIFAQVRDAVVKARIPVDSSEITMIPQNTIRPTNDEAEKLLKMLRFLEELDDVQAVYANFDIPDDVLEKLM